MFLRTAGRYRPWVTIISKHFLQIQQSLTLYHTIPTQRKKALENTVGKGENAGNQHFLLFPTVFSTLSKREIIIVTTSILSSTTAFNLDKAKILSFGRVNR